MIDNYDEHIILILQRDARIAFKALAKQVGLSAPAVAERVRRMEDIGVITGYRLQVDRKKIGWQITAFVRLKCKSERYQAIHRIAHDSEEILECHHVLGEDSFILKVIAQDLAHLEMVLARLGSHAMTLSTLSLSSLIEGKPVIPKNVKS